MFESAVLLEALLGAYAALDLTRTRPRLESVLDAAAAEHGLDVLGGLLADLRGGYQWRSCYGYSHPLSPATSCAGGQRGPDWSSEATMVVPTGAAFIGGSRARRLRRPPSLLHLQRRDEDSQRWQLARDARPRPLGVSVGCQAGARPRAVLLRHWAYLPARLETPIDPNRPVLHLRGRYVARRHASRAGARPVVEALDESPSGRSGECGCRRYAVRPDPGQLRGEWGADTERQVGAQRGARPEEHVAPDDRRP